jgi:alpha-glucosidase
LGVRGIWIDMNEPTTFREESGKTLPNHLGAHGDGVPTTMAEVHNVYALAQARATYEGMRAVAPGRRPFLLTRAGYAGIQRYAAVWTGDTPSLWETLRETLPMMLGLGLSGVPFVGSDVGGYGGRATPELFARWIQLGAISPFFRVHTEHRGAQQEPWQFGVEVEDLSRAVIAERYRLLPYLYSLFHEAAMTGAPVLRPLFYEFPTDPGSETRDDQAMLGPWLLYAPVLEASATTRRIYLPPGRWFELSSGAIVDGPTTVEKTVTLAALPAFAREGAIVPRGPLLAYSDEAPLSPLFIEVYPGSRPTSFAHYEDDGDSFDHEQGAYSRVTYSLQKTAAGATLRASPSDGRFVPPARTLVVRVRRVDAGARGASLSGEALPAAASYDALVASGRGYWYDQRDLSLVVAFPDRPDFTLTLDYDPATPQPAPPVLVRFEVTVPAGTPTDRPICVATSANDWTHQPLAWSDRPNVAAGTVTLPRGDWFSYKYTRGDWTTVEKWTGCAEASNRYGLGAANPTRTDRVETWADWCR